MPVATFRWLIGLPQTLCAELSPAEYYKAWMVLETYASVRHFGCTGLGHIIDAPSARVM